VLFEALARLDRRLASDTGPRPAGRRRDQNGSITPTTIQIPDDGVSTTAGDLDQAIKSLDCAQDFQERRVSCLRFRQAKLSNGVEN